MFLHKIVLGGAIMSMIVMFVFVNPRVSAQSSSPHYQVEESFFGTGGELDASSSEYRARQSAGELGVGHSASDDYQMQAGFNTTDQPLLEFAVFGGIYDLGVLDPTITGSAVASFSVRNYLSNGYVVIANGATPSITTGTPHTLAALAVPTTSQVGVEQFGINLADNSNPNIGAVPAQVPDNTYSFGAAVAGYDTTNQFKFVDGDTIAFSNKSSGRTDYSLSIIANTSRSTPSGEYGGQLNLQAIPTF